MIATIPRYLVLSDAAIGSNVRLTVGYTYAIRRNTFPNLLLFCFFAILGKPLRFMMQYIDPTGVGMFSSPQFDVTVPGAGT